MKQFMKQLAARYLFIWARLVIAERRPKIVAVTGSVGKTTTKEAIATVLQSPAAAKYLGLVGKSGESLNSELGLPLAVLGFSTSPKTSLVGWLAVFFLAPFKAWQLATIKAYPRILVLEYAADRPGDILRLVQLAPPLVACVTAVGPAHLERFGTVAGVSREKGRLVEAVPRHGYVVLARDNRQAALLVKRAKSRVRLVPGRGVALAKAIALAVADYFELPQNLAQQALLPFTNPAGRLEVKRLGTLRLIDDTYNANPLSMELALDTLGQERGRRVAILGDMRELGDDSLTYHKDIGDYARLHSDLLIGVGELARSYQASIWYPTARAAARAVPGLLKPRDRVLVKGSRGVHMEHIIETVTNVFEARHGRH